MDLFPKSDPYLCVMMETGGGNYQVVAKTKHIDDCHEPEWPEILEIEDDSIRKDNDKLQLRIEILDYDGPGRADDMCGGIFTLEQLSHLNKPLPLKNKKDKNKGELLVKYFKIKEK